MCVPKRLRITHYAIASAMGATGAFLGYSKGVTLSVVLALMAIIEGINYLAQRRQRHATERRCRSVCDTAQPSRYDAPGAAR